MDVVTEFREVVPDQTELEKWIEITLNTGGTQSTLQDFKLTERTGGYSYLDQNNFYTRNRFIYWRFSKDVLELIEQSLDINLSGNRVRYKFADTPILDGITIHEVGTSVIILVATVCGVHRLVFPHPSFINSSEHSYTKTAVDYTSLSIFAEASRSEPKKYIINNSNANSPLPHTSATGLTANEEECLFALAYSSGNTLLIRMNSHTDYVAVVELSQEVEHFVSRFISRALRGKSNEDTVAVSMLFHNLNGETLLFSMCRDGNIRVWSPQRHQSVLVTNFPPNSAQGAENHVIKKSETPSGDLIIGILHNYTDKIEFHLFMCVPGPYVELQNVLSVCPPEDSDIVDFGIIGYRNIWAIFRSPSGVSSLAHYEGRWQFCILENAWQHELPTEGIDFDPKEVYLDFIFHPGRFPTSVISRALSIYRKANIATDSYISTQGLKERICAVVDAEIKTEMQNQDLNDEEVMDIMISSWKKFYGFVVEYYESGTRPLGILPLSHNVPNLNSSSVLYKSTCEEIDEETIADVSGSESNKLVVSGAVLIKKSYISLIRPVDPVESVALDFKTIVFPTDVQKFIMVLSLLDCNIGDAYKVNFDKYLREQRSPVQIVTELLLQDLNNEDILTNLNVMNNTAAMLNAIENIGATFTCVLDLLNVHQPDLEDELAVENSRWILHLGHLFNSQFGMSFVAATLQQIVLIRYDLCRTLLIFLHVIQMNEFRNFFKRKIEISQNFIDLTSQLIQCYFLILWVAQTPIYTLTPLDNFETSVSLLKLVDTRSTLIGGNSSKVTQTITLLQLFLKSSASASVRLLLSKRNICQNSVKIWSSSLLPFIEILTQLIWPVCTNTIFPEFLLSSNQNLHMQTYSRLLIKWCHSNSYTRKFLLACSFFDTGELEKAYDLFMKASHGVCIDEFLIKKVLKVDFGLPKDRLLVLYFCKIITLFEQSGAYDLIVKLAENGISVATEKDSELATLHSVIFLNRLKLGQYKQAYKALMDNPDCERRKDCLQQLVVTLIEAQQLATLLHFSYEGIQSELERIVEARARSLDVFNNVYYSFAYAFYTKRDNFRKAGCIMYEQAYRISTSQQTTLDALKKQVNCLVVALNSLSLVNSEDAWIVKPAEVIEQAFDANNMSMECEKSNIEVLLLKDLHKELTLAKARLKAHMTLPNQNALPAVPLSAHEVIGVLVHNGYYQDSLKVCRLFDISPASTFSGLTSACVRLDETPMDSAWDWLRENDIEGLGEGTAATISWRLLERLLSNEERNRESYLHRVVASEILRLGAFLPQWFLSSYKKRNPSEILRLLLLYGRLEEAGELAIEFLEAVQGPGKDRFGLDTALLPTMPAVWIPHNIIDLILIELKAHSKDEIVYKELASKLESVQSDCLKKIVMVSKDKLDILQQDMQKMRAC